MILIKIIAVSKGCHKAHQQTLENEENSEQFSGGIKQLRNQKDVQKNPRKFSGF